MHPFKERQSLPTLRGPGSERGLPDTLLERLTGLGQADRTWDTSGMSSSLSSAE